MVQTDPPAGEPVSMYQVVTLRVNLGPEYSPFAMISLLGMNELIIHAETGDEISMTDWIYEELGLIVREVSHQPNAFYLEGMVSFQSIPPGTPVMAGDYIDITISTGSAIPAAAPPPADDPPAAEQPDNQPDTPEQPTDTTPPDDTPAPPPPVSDTLNIALWSGVAEDAESVRLILRSRAEGGSMETVNQWTVPVASFPISVPVSGDGFVEFLIFSLEDDGEEILRARQDFTFSQ